MSTIRKIITNTADIVNELESVFESDNIIVSSMLDYLTNTPKPDEISYVTNRGDTIINTNCKYEFVSFSHLIKWGLWLVNKYIPVDDKIFIKRNKNRITGSFGIYGFCVDFYGEFCIRFTVYEENNSMVLYMEYTVYGYDSITFMKSDIYTKAISNNRSFIC